MSRRPTTAECASDTCASVDRSVASARAVTVLAAIADARKLLAPALGESPGTTALDDALAQLDVALRAGDHAQTAIRLDMVRAELTKYLARSERADIAAVRLALDEARGLLGRTTRSTRSP